MKLTRILAISSIALGTVMLLLTTKKGSEMRKTMADKSGDMWKKMRKMPGMAAKRMDGVRSDAMEMMS